jgi:hypothetical protein
LEYGLLVLYLGETRILCGAALDQETK